MQGCELLAQELRESFLNSRLAGHAGQAWARLDLAGCELRPGAGHADALRQARWPGRGAGLLADPLPVTCC